MVIAPCCRRLRTSSPSRSHVSCSLRPSALEPGGEPPARLAAQLDPEQAAALQGLPVVGRHQFCHQPQSGFPLPLLPGKAPFEDVRTVGGPDQVVGDVVDVRGVVIRGRAGQGVEDEPPVLDGLVAGFQVGGEEGGRLPAVAEQQQLAAFPGLVGLHRHRRAGAPGTARS